MPPITRKKRKLNLNAPYPAYINLPSLPPIILEHIFQTVAENSTSSLVAVTRSSKLFYDLATPILYRKVRLTSDDQVLRLLDGMDNEEVKLEDSGRRRSKRTAKKDQPTSGVIQRYRSFGFARTITLDYVPDLVACKRIQSVGSAFASSCVFPSVKRVIFGSGCLASIHHERRARYHNIITGCMARFARIAKPSFLLFDLSACITIGGCDCIGQTLLVAQVTWTGLDTIIYQGPTEAFWDRYCLIKHSSYPVTIELRIDEHADTDEEIWKDARAIRYLAMSLWKKTLGKYCAGHTPTSPTTIYLPPLTPETLRLFQDSIEEQHTWDCGICIRKQTMDKPKSGLRFVSLPAVKVEEIDVTMTEQP